MKVKFIQSRKLGSKVYAKNQVAEIPDAFAKDWFFKAQVKDGFISILPKDEAAQKLQAAKDELAVSAAADAAKEADAGAAKADAAPSEEAAEDKNSAASKGGFSSKKK